MLAVKVRRTDRKMNKQMSLQISWQNTKKRRKTIAAREEKDGDLPTLNEVGSPFQCGSWDQKIYHQIDSCQVGSLGITFSLTPTLFDAFSHRCKRVYRSVRRPSDRPSVHQSVCLTVFTIVVLTVYPLIGRLQFKTHGKLFFLKIIATWRNCRSAGVPTEIPRTKCNAVYAFTLSDLFPFDTVFWLSWEWRNNKK